MKKMALIVVVALLVACKKDARGNAALQVRTARVGRGEYSEALETFGTISYKTKHDVTALVAGNLDEILARDGDFVNEGDELARLRNIQVEIQLAQARNDVSTALATLETTLVSRQETELDVESRLLSLESGKIELEQKRGEYQNLSEKFDIDKELFELGGVTLSDIKDAQLALENYRRDIELLEKNNAILSLGLRDEDLLAAGMQPSADAAEKKRQLVALNCRSIDSQISAARLALDNARKNLASAQRLFDELTLRSKSSGIVATHYFEVGEHIEANEQVFTVMDTATVQAIFPVQESDVNKFGVGSPTHVTVQSLNADFDTTVCEISPIANSQTGNFTVKADLVNAGNEIKPGMFAKCVVQNQICKNAEFLPESCIVKKNGETATVFAVIGETLVLKNIEILRQKDGKIWFDRDLSANEVVVDCPNATLKEGMKVLAS